MTARHSLLTLLLLWALLALGLKARPETDPPSEQDPAPITLRRVELECYRSPRPILFVGPCDVPTDTLMANGHEGDQAIKIVALPEQTRITRQVYGQDPITTTVDAPSLMYRLASLRLSNPVAPPQMACPLTVEHNLEGTAVLRLKLVQKDGKVVEQTATAHFANCACLRSGTEVFGRVNDELRRAGLSI